MELDAIVDVHNMVDQGTHTVEDAPSIAKRFEEEVLATFAIADSIQEECRDPQLAKEEVHNGSDGENNFDMIALE